MPHFKPITVSSTKDFFEQIKDLKNFSDQLYDITFTDKYENTSLTLYISGIYRYLLAGAKQASYICIRDKSNSLASIISNALYSNLEFSLIDEDILKYIPERGGKIHTLVDKACVFLRLCNNTAQRNSIAVKVAENLTAVIQQIGMQSDIQIYYQHLLCFETALNINHVQTNITMQAPLTLKMASAWFELAKKVGDYDDVRHLADCVTFAERSVEYSIIDNKTESNKNYLTAQLKKLREKSPYETDSRTTSWLSIVMNFSRLHWFRGVIPDLQDAATLQACLKRFRFSRQHNGQNILQGYADTDTDTDTDTELYKTTRDDLTSFLKMSEDIDYDMRSFAILEYFDALQCCVEVVLNNFDVSKKHEIFKFLFGDISELNFNGLQLVAKCCPTNTLKLLTIFEMENTFLACKPSNNSIDIFSAILSNNGHDNFLTRLYQDHNDNFHALCRSCNLTLVLNNFFKKDQFQTFETQHQLLTKLYQGSKPNTSGNLNERFSLNMLDGSQYVKDLFMGIYKTPATKAIFIQVCFTRWQDIANEIKNSKAESSESSSIWELASSLWVSKEPPQHELQITAIKEVYAELRSDNKEDSNLDVLITRDYMTLETAAKSEIDAKLNPTYIDNLCG